MKELGAYLKRTRISSGLSITEVAEDLELSTSHLENIESGNVRAFKDVYDLKELVKQYAKYLGLDPEKVVDEFNGFLFEHTSKISLDDIRAAQKKETKKKIKSPYTQERKKEFKMWPVIGIIVFFVIVFLVIYAIVSNINKAPARVDELLPRRENVYEFAN